MRFGEGFKGFFATAVFKTAWGVILFFFPLVRGALE